MIFADILNAKKNQCFVFQKVTNKPRFEKTFFRLKRKTFVIR